MNYPHYGFSEEDAENHLARFVRLDNPDSYPFDEVHAHEYGELLVFIKGSGTHCIDFGEHAIADRSFHLLAPGCLHWIERGMDSEGFAVVYKDSFLYKLHAFNEAIDLPRFYKNSRILNLDKKAFAEFENLVAELLHHQHDHHYLLNLIGTLLTKIALSDPETSLSFNNAPQDQTVLQFLELVRLHFRRQPRVADYAAMMCISESALEKKIKKATGRSIFVLGQEWLLKEAKRMLFMPGANMKVIAGELHFKEPSHFSNWFKKKTGQSPTAFQKGK